ncbi:MAG: LacI family DNA-binding transcriptional regulator [Fibrella sp.]|nr:LacI family DNA-binding transcriptional regulator [Armatimonadota bacterium]
MNRQAKVTRSVATLADVAREAGVSKNAVSVVLNGAKASTRVSDGTRQRILEAAERLQYRPNTSAQSLVRGRTNTVGVLFGGVDLQNDGISNEYGASVLSGIVVACDRYDFNLTLFAKSWYRSNKDAVVYRDQQMDGIVVVAPHTDSALVEEFVSQGIQVSAISYPAPPDADGTTAWDSTDVDNRRGAELATEHLIRLGHRRIAHLMGTPTLVSAPLRRDGYLAVLKRANIPFAEELLIQGLPVGAPGCASGSYGAETVPEDTRRLLALPDPPTAIFAANDRMALEVFRSVSAAGIAVPEQLSIIGFDDFSFASILEPPLTTVRQPLSAIGERSAELLIARILVGGSRSQEETAVKPPTIYLLSPELIVRGSTGPAPLSAQKKGG